MADMTKYERRISTLERDLSQAIDLLESLGYWVCWSCREGGGEAQDYILSASEPKVLDADGNLWCENCRESYERE